LKYIIQPGVEIGNTENTNINVLTKEEIKAYQKSGFKCREEIHQLTSGHIEYQIICVEIWQKGDKEHSLLIPPFFFPHRGYPAYVYAYAINLYSSDPQLSQREVAEKTRKKYDLKTFAHTTVGRAMKALSNALKETAAIDSETENGERAVDENQISAGTNHAGGIPTVQDTKGQREIVKSYYGGRLKDYIQAGFQGFQGACKCVSIYWYTHFFQLLM
jgi:hypothetical protein